MSYIGTPPSNAFTSLLKQDFSTSATTGYTLDHAVNNANDIALFINFVRQEPTAGYAASGTSLVLTSATASSDDMYCVYLGQALQTVNPSNASVGTAQLADSSVTSAKLASGAVANTPAFEAYLSANQSVSDATATKVAFNVELFDTNSAYDNSSNYRFTPQVAGKYFIYADVSCFAGNSNLAKAKSFIYKNGSAIKVIQFNFTSNYARQMHTMISSVIDMNGSSDYIEIFGLVDTNSGSGQLFNGNTTAGEDRSFFGAYKIIQ